MNVRINLLISIKRKKAAGICVSIAVNFMRYCNLKILRVHEDLIFKMFFHVFIFFLISFNNVLSFFKFICIYFICKSVLPTCMSMYHVLPGALKL